ncbi:hypothetical protein BJ138DRAFT_1165241 [Hygrophoropsis aurantiaca]|uniref:Uncharacterized protein n=1 Tax=Hygrophoropsis aurantiaca TaxID=72124 RepID=A0ACB7ZWC1_9AGAM|nr:hypothetical protein BJ138DRAFT_1165241 [Hygrophoropsis aurantiaca]
MFIGDAYNGIEAFLSVLLMANIEIILMRRLFALFNYEKFVVVPIAILYFLIFGSMIGVCVVEILVDVRDMTTFIICIGGYSHSYMYWLLPMMPAIFDFILIALVGYKSMQHYLRVPDRTWSGARLVRTLARDSFAYFFCSFAVYLAQILLVRLLPSEYIMLASGWVLVIPPVSANYLLIGTAPSHVYADDMDSSYTNSSFEISACPA